MTEFQNSSIAGSASSPEGDSDGRNNRSEEQLIGEQFHSLAQANSAKDTPTPTDQEYRWLVIGSVLALIISSVVLFPRVLRDSSGKLPSDVGQEIDSELRDSAFRVGTGAGLFLVAFISLIVIINLLKTTKNWGQDNPHYGHLAQTLMWCIGLAFIIPRLIYLFSFVSLWLFSGLWLGFVVVLVVYVIKRHRTDPRWYIVTSILVAAATSLLFFGNLFFMVDATI